MITRTALALAMASTFWLIPTPAHAAATGVELISDPDFQSIHDVAAPWQCDDPTESVDNGGPVIGAEFTQLIGARDGEVPGAVPPPPIEAPHQLFGGPTADTPAGCTQIVPVEPGGTYRLQVDVQGGPVVLATGYGTVSSPASKHWTTLETSFTVAADRRAVTVTVHGRRGGGPYYAADVSLIGPPSTVRRPVAPTALRSDRRTSTTARLSWRASPGATGYRVLRDGQTLVTTKKPSALIPELTLGTSPRLTVRALNPAGESPQSAAFTVGPLTEWTTVPDRPADVTARLWWGMTIIELTPSERATDGYEVFLDGELVGWMYDAKGSLDVPDGPHVITVTALNAVGSSEPSDPVYIGVDAEDEE